MRNGRVISVSFSVQPRREMNRILYRTIWRRSTISKTLFAITISVTVPFAYYHVRLFTHKKPLYTSFVDNFIEI